MSADSPEPPFPPQAPAAATRHGVLLVLSAPSGGGKSAVLARLRQREPELLYSVSVTTRPPRPGEVDGREYHFATPQQFDELIRAGVFYEWAAVHNHRYGTRADTIAAARAAGRDVALDIDVQGALNVKRRSPDAVLVFLAPPSLEVLEQRLRGRGTDGEAQILVRLANARSEMEQAPRYDYRIVNDDLNRTVDELDAILNAERRRSVH